MSIDLKDIIYKKHTHEILNINELSMSSGKTIGIMGPNGAGKSTMVKIMALLEPPNNGCLVMDGQPIDLQNPPLQVRRKFSIALQQSLLLNTTVFQNVAIGLKLRKSPKKYIEEQVRYWLEMFQISHLEKKHAAHLSGGEAQRVNLARAMAINPEILFLDEPFSALDFPTKIQLLSDLKKIIKEMELTTIFVSHDLMEIKYIADELVIIMDGQVAQVGDTREVINHPNEVTQEFIKKFDLLLND